MRIWIGIILLFGCAGAYGQIGVSQQLAAPSMETRVYSQHTVPRTSLEAITPGVISRKSWLASRSEPSLMSSSVRNWNHEARHYGFFCKVESKIERKSGLAPRFRLGSADYVDALEGKYSPVIK